MKSRQAVWELLGTAFLFGSLGISDAEGFGPRRVFVTPGYSYYPYPATNYSYYYNPYIVPLPAYGILPPPNVNLVYGADWQGYGVQRTAQDYGYPRDPLAPPARMRSSEYPAIPFERTPEVRLTDRRRVRFEITVPFANAIVTFDGAKTTQTGLTRVFVTPPMQEDKDYSVTISVQWPTQDGTLSAPRQKTFTVVAGETVQHTFIE